MRPGTESLSPLRGSILVFFFFQAEDGIRDVAVTGVQTCALPISRFLVFSTGYQANLGIVSGLVGRGDVVFLDKLDHASIVDGAKMSYGQTERFKIGRASCRERV